MDQEELDQLAQESWSELLRLRDELNQIENVTYIPNVQRISDFKRACTILQSIFKTQIQNHELELRCEARADHQTGMLTPLSPGAGHITIIAPKIELQNESLTQFVNAVSTATSWALSEANKEGMVNLYFAWNQLYTTILPDEN